MSHVYLVVFALQRMRVLFVNFVLCGMRTCPMVRVSLNRRIGLLALRLFLLRIILA